MLRGLLGGALTGIVFSALGLSVISMLAPQPPGNEPPLPPQVDVPQASVANTVEPPTAPAAPNTNDTAPDLSDLSAVEISDSDTDLPLADTAPAAVPEVSGLDGGLLEPEAAEAGAVALDSDGPVLPSPQAEAPIEPGSEQGLSIETSPATPQPKSEEEVVAIVEPPSDGPALQTPSVEENALPSTQPVEEPIPVIIEPETSEEIAPEAEPIPDVGLSGEPATQMPSGDNKITINRPGEENEIEVDPQELTIELAGRALQDYAAAFEGSGKPLISLILVDDGEMAGGPEALGASGTHVSVAIDPTKDGAGQLMRAYRDQGIEVVALLKLPTGALGSDIEVALEGMMNVLPEASSVMATQSSNLSNSPASLDQVMAALADNGFGFVLEPSGLNMPLRAAEDYDVPSALIYRDVDGEGQDARVIRRFLDQAAFKARQESGVVLLGRVRPDTISAVILWATANRAGQVDQAPLSAVLLAQ